MHVHVDELTPEEIAAFTRRSILKAQLRGDSKAAHKGQVLCTYCRCEMSQSQARLSHIVPPALGGQTDVKNVVLACGICCTSKSGRTLQEWCMLLMTQQDSVQRLMVNHQSPERIEAPKEKTAA